MDRAQVIAELRKKQGSMSLKAFASAYGLSAAYINDVYCGNRAPGPSILNILGLELTKTVTMEYERKGKS